jgi:hypothetical protein
MRNCNKRGVWSYKLGSFTKFKTDNGVKYSRADYEAYIKIKNLDRVKKS